MTIIAAAIDKDGTIYMGCDHVASSEDGRVKITRAPKVRVNGGYLIGHTGTLRQGQIALFLFKPPVREKGKDLFEYMVTDFATALRKCMKEHGGEVKDENGDEAMNGCLLVATEGRIFEVDGAYAVVEVRESYHGVGCAADKARSAMHARRRARAESMVGAGLKAAAEFDINIRPPFTVESIKKVLKTGA